MKRRTFLASTAGLTWAATADQTKNAPISFGVITDIQYADVAPQGERHYRESLPKLDRILPLLSAKELSFTLHLGDVIDRSFSSYEPVLKRLEKLPHPCHHLLGNHDYEVSDREKASVLSALKMPHDYYALYLPGWRFLMLDTNAVSTYKQAATDARSRTARTILEQMQQEKKAHGVPWGGGCGTDQLLWLRRELTAAQDAGDQVILCAHHPLLPADAHQVWDTHEILPLIAEFPCVKAWFNGHNHAGAYATHQGIHCLTFRSVLHEPEVFAAAVVTLHPKHIEIKGLGREESRQLPLR